MMTNELSNNKEDGFFKNLLIIDQIMDEIKEKGVIGDNEHTRFKYAIQHLLFQEFSKIETTEKPKIKIVDFAVEDIVSMAENVDIRVSDFKISNAIKVEVALIKQYLNFIMEGQDNKISVEDLMQLFEQQFKAYEIMKKNKEEN